VETETTDIPGKREGLSEHGGEPKNGICSGGKGNKKMGGSKTGGGNEGHIPKYV
jgi:hypothetical protein